MHRVHEKLPAILGEEGLADLNLLSIVSIIPTS